MDSPKKRPVMLKVFPSDDSFMLPIDLPIVASVHVFHEVTPYEADALATLPVKLIPVFHFHAGAVEKYYR